jgi:hypothetical protein
MCFFFHFCDVAQVVINLFFSEILPKNDHEKKKGNNLPKGENFIKKEAFALWRFFLK